MEEQRVVIADESIDVSQLLGWHVPGLPPKSKPMDNDDEKEKQRKMMTTMMKMMRVMDTWTALSIISRWITAAHWLERAPCNAGSTSLSLFGDGRIGTLSKAFAYSCSLR